MPESVMLVSKVTLGPQLRGTLKHARAPLRDQACSGRREVLVEHSSTNTNRLAPILSATNALQVALRNSSCSVAPSDPFFGSIPGA